MGEGLSAGSAKLLRITKASELLKNDPNPQCNLVEYSTAGDPGTSGGPLFDESAQLTGVNGESDYFREVMVVGYAISARPLRDHWIHVGSRLGTHHLSSPLKSENSSTN